MASLTVEKPASVYPVTLDLAKNFLRVDSTDDDMLIMSLIGAATGFAEGFTERSFIAKGYKQTLDSFPYFVDTVMSQLAYPPSYYALPRYSTTFWNYSQMIKLFAPPLISVDRITYLSATDSQWHDLVPVPSLWYPGKTVKVNDTVMDNNGNVQKCTVAGTTAANPPVWNKAVSGTTTETSPDPAGEGSVTPVQWQNQGPFLGNPNVGQTAPAQFGCFIADTESEPGRIFPGPPGGLWPQVLYVPNAVQIHFTAGYGIDGNAVPDEIKTAILQLVANWYENREAAMMGNLTEVPNHVKALLWMKRVMDMQPTRG